MSSKKKKEKGESVIQQEKKISPRFFNAFK